MSLDKTQPHPETGYTYAQWMRAVNNHVMNLAGVSISDLGDFSSYDMWADGMPAEEAAREVLEENDFPFED